MRRFNASHFRLHDQEWARYRIPADHSHDDDLLMSAFIEHVKKLEAVKLAAERVIKIWNGNHTNFYPEVMSQLAAALSADGDVQKDA